MLVVYLIFPSPPNMWSRCMWKRGKFWTENAEKKQILKISCSAEQLQNSFSNRT